MTKSSRKNRVSISAFATVASAIAFALSGPADANVIRPVSVSGTIAGDAGSSVAYLISDNPGFAAATLQRPVGTAVTVPTGENLANALATLHARGGTAQAESWTRPSSVGNPVFSFDLGSEIPIGSIILWQYGNDGGAGVGNEGNDTRDFELIFHTSAEGSAFSFASGGGAEATEFSGTTATVGNGTANNVAQLFDFGSPQNARYVGLRIATNYLGQPGITAGGTRFGLGEVRFVAVPEPSTGVFGILAIGALVLIPWRRRKR